MKKNTYTLSPEVVNIVRHIFDARIDNASRPSAIMAYHAARDIFEYALAGNVECLREFDYLLTQEEKEKIEKLRGNS